MGNMEGEISSRFRRPSTSAAIPFDAARFNLTLMSLTLPITAFLCAARRCSATLRR
jgi:hypothetical protein